MLVPALDTVCIYRTKETGSQTGKLVLEQHRHSRTKNCLHGGLVEDHPVHIKLASVAPSLPNPKKKEKKQSWEQ